MNVLDLFSGIGGFSLGLERSGMRTVAFCEIKPFARRILAERWPGVPCYDDVRTLTADRLRADGIVADVICGGFPCQDISSAGRGAGIDGARSGLWSEYARIIGELRPRYVIVENVAALLGRGLDRVLGDLAALGYDAEWHCIPASAVGAPHRRDRIWIVSYPGHWTKPERTREAGRQARERTAERGIAGRDGETRALADATGEHGDWRGTWPEPSGRYESSDGGADVPRAAHYASISEGIRRGDTAGQWWTEPDVGRVAHGVSARVDRLEGLGNAVVPQIPEIIGRAIMNDVWKNRQIDDLQRMCAALIAEKQRLRRLLEQVATACEVKPQSEAEDAVAIVIREALKVDLSTLSSQQGNTP